MGRKKRKLPEVPQFNKKGKKKRGKAALAGVVIVLTGAAVKELKKRGRLPSAEAVGKAGKKAAKTAKKAAAKTASTVQDKLPSRDNEPQARS